MKYYAGIDVSLKDVYITIIDDKGNVVKEGFVVNDYKLISKYMDGYSYEKIGIESGQLSIHLCKSLIKEGLNVICVDARHMAAALSARINKNDKNDAYGIANMMRLGWYRSIQIKSDKSCSYKILLGSRRQLVNVHQRLKGSIRGLLKIYGICLGKKVSTASFSQLVVSKIKDLDEISKLSIQSLLDSLISTSLSINKLDEKLKKYSDEDEDCKLLMSVPGVGPVTALTYKTAIDDASRFNKSDTVGAYMGLTPKQYSSGEIDRHGRISKMGPAESRWMLYESAMCLLTRSKKKSQLKSWGLKLAKKKGMSKAVVAVARKLAVIMHSMLIHRTTFSSKLGAKLTA